MSKKINRYILMLALFTGIGCGTLYAFLQRDTSIIQQQQLSERINLALRRTAHLLLKQAGDSTSMIAPVKQTGENTYLVTLSHAFNYDSLPSFLQKSLDFQEIKNRYDVAVRDCAHEELILGYSWFDMLKKEGVPCLGRSQTKDCLNFSVTFTDPSVQLSKTPYLWFLSGGLFVLILGLMVYFYSNKNKLISQPMMTNVPERKDQTHLIYIGQTIFDTRNQTLLIDNIEQKLTFQEAQLLQLFCQHQNELLERDFILKTVWGDEGVLITRSIDVFVSRLRKLLKPDASLKIANVHNRGYRFETLGTIR